MITSYSISAATDRAQLMVRIRADGDADAHGTVILGSEADHGRPGVLIAEGATAACADVDGDGIAGLTLLVVTFFDVESGEQVIGVVTPPDGGEFTDVGPATLRFDGPRLSGAIEGIARRLGRPLTARRS
jgi:hypothetical protein